MSAAAPTRAELTAGRNPSTAAQIGGLKAKKRGQRTEDLFMSAANRYEAQGQATAMHVGPPIKTLGGKFASTRAGRAYAKAARVSPQGFPAVRIGDGPPDFLVSITPPNAPPRQCWIEVKGRQLASMPLISVEDHQRDALRAHTAAGTPGLILACLRHPKHLGRGGWWLVPANHWTRGDAGDRESMTPERMGILGVQCMDINAPDRPAGPDAVPDWLEALRALDSRDVCLWRYPIWGQS